MNENLAHHIHQLYKAPTNTTEKTNVCRPMLWTFVVFLLLSPSVAEEEADAQEMFNNEELYEFPPIDFRCLQFSLGRFIFNKDTYSSMYYTTDPTPDIPTGCLIEAGEKGHKNIVFYPRLTALDPMMEFYIHQIYEGMPFIPITEVALFGTKAEKRKQYCMDLRLIGSIFADYFETFHSDKETCRELKQIVIECANFREMWEFWVKNIYEKLCLDEDGCYNAMEYYDEDLPFCVKHIASGQFQNSSFGSWHHSIFNYCELTDMVPQANDDNYDRLILSEDGKTEDELLTMCQFLRFRLLPEEGKEEEIREITLTIRGKDKDRDRNSHNVNSAFYPNLVHVPIISLILAR